MGYGTINLDYLGLLFNYKFFYLEIQILKNKNKFQLILSKYLYLHNCIT